MKPRYKDRVPMKCPVIFTVGTQVGEGRVLDLTIPGCLIESPVVVHKGDSLQLKMYLPGVKAPFSTTLAMVRWTKGTQFGVEFIKMDESQRQLLNRFMAQHLPELAPMRKKNAFTEVRGQNWHLETYSISR